MMVIEIVYRLSIGLIFTRFECRFKIFTRFECSFKIVTRFECSLGWRDRIYARFFARMPDDALHDLFGATWAVHYRCLSICVDVIIE